MPAGNRSRSTRVCTCQWRETRLEITHVQRWCEGIDHIEVRSAGRVPLPITETGYRSLFTASESLSDYEDAQAYVLAWLEHEAAGSAWQRQEEEARQLTLF